MMGNIDLPDVLPVFPLSGALLLPRSRLPLHLFEPRYLAMLDFALKSENRMIAMVQPSLTSGLRKIGCAGRITSFSETEDRRYMITLTGVSRFTLGTQEPGFHPFLRYHVDWSAFEPDRHPQAVQSGWDKDGFMVLLAKYLDEFGLSTDWNGLKEAEDELLVNTLSMLCPFETEDKQALLEAPTVTQRCEVLTALIEMALRGGATEEVMQ